MTTVLQNMSSLLMSARTLETSNQRRTGTLTHHMHRTRGVCRQSELANDFTLAGGSA